MATVKLVLDKRRKKKSGAYPLVIRVRKNDKYFDIQTNQELYDHQFNAKIGFIIGNKSLSKSLQFEVETYKDQIYQLEFLNDDVSINVIRDTVLKKQKFEPSISEFWIAEANRLMKIGKAGNANVYLNAHLGLKRVLNLDLPFRNLKHLHLLDAETLLLKNGVKLNTLSVYMRTLRAICNKAILVDLVDRSWYPFQRYKIKKGKSAPRTLDSMQMKMYFALNLNVQHPLYRSYCIGKLIFLLRGINFKDLIKLTKQNVVNNRIVYERSKTKTFYSIGMEEEINVLLRKLFRGGETLIGVMDDEIQALNHDIKVVKRYGQHLHVVNNHLKKIGKMLGFEVSLSTYVMRYSYANISRSVGISVEEISYLLGHKSAHSVTEIYLEEFDIYKLDMLSRKVIDAVIGE
jgi:integrase/recombinase XerD